MNDILHLHPVIHGDKKLTDERYSKRLSRKKLKAVHQTPFNISNERMAHIGFGLRESITYISYTFISLNGF